MAFPASFGSENGIMQGCSTFSICDWNVDSRAAHEKVDNID